MREEEGRYTKGMSGSLFMLVRVDMGKGGVPSYLKKVGVVGFEEVDVGVGGVFGLWLVVQVSWFAGEWEGRVTDHIACDR